MALSADALKRLMIATTSLAAGNEIATAINLGSSQATQDLFVFPLVIVATSTSTTTNFASLAVGDLVVVIPAAAGNSHFVTVATAGTLPEAAVVGSLYLALRPYAAPANTAGVF